MHEKPRKMSPADCTACTVRPVADAAAPRVLFAHGGGSPFQVNFKYYFFKGVRLLQNTNPPIILHFPLHDANMRLTSLFACFCCARRTQEYNAHCIATAAAAASALARASLACAARERRGAARERRGAEPQTPLAAALATVASSATSFCPRRHPRRLPRRRPRRRPRRCGMLQLSVRGCAVVCRVGRGGVLHARMHVPRADFVRGVVWPAPRRQRAAR